MAPSLWAKTPEAMTLDPTLTNSARRLYAYLDLRAGQRGYWYGTQAEITLDLGISARTIRRATRLLEAGEYIRTLRTIEHRTALKYFITERPPPPDSDVRSPRTPMSALRVRVGSGSESGSGPQITPQRSEPPYPPSRGEQMHSSGLGESVIRRTWS